eukprot:432910-Amphidinium_carterae.1
MPVLSLVLVIVSEIAQLHKVGQKNAVNLGIVQFCVEAQAGLDKMSQMRSGTNFGNALQLCSSMLANYTKDGGAFRADLQWRNGRGVLASRGAKWQRAHSDVPRMLRV